MYCEEEVQEEEVEIVMGDYFHGIVEANWIADHLLQIANLLEKTQMLFPKSIHGSNGAN